MSEPFRVAVLASGSGSNFQAILDELHHAPESPVKVVALIASRPGIRAIDRATASGVPAVVLPDPSQGREAAASSLAEALRDAGPDLVVLAGYLRLIPPEIVRAHWGRMINIHPALLPAFGGEGMYGRNVHRAVIERGARVSGVTVHFVDEVYDHGPIIAQWPVPVLEADTPETLAARVLGVEHELLPTVVDAIARGHVQVAPSGTCEWSVPWFDGQRFAIESDAGGGRSASDEAAASRSDDHQPTQE